VFTKSEILWLAQHGLSLDDVYDGRWESQRQRRRGAKAAGKVLILGSPCRAAGHRLRTRSHHCVQCNTANLGFQNRYNSPGYVYIAGSYSGRVIKLGIARDIMQRESQLKSERHAGLDDWEVLFFITVGEAGRVENEASRRVKGRRVTAEYFKDGVLQTATEILEASYASALEAITQTVGGLEGFKVWEWTRAHEYDFEYSYSNSGSDEGAVF
jgi:hypothetical protein